jgi:hypothetical protein
MTDHAMKEKAEGLPLMDAIKAFGPPDIVKLIGNQTEKGELDAAFGRASGADSFRSLLQWAVETLVAATKAKASEITSKQATKLAVQRVIDDLRAGRLVASGVNPARKPPVREIIPQSFWPPVLKWRGRGMTLLIGGYDSVRIVKAEDVPDCWERPEERKTETGPVAGRKNGRPSKADAINAAYDRMTKDYARNFTDHIPALRAIAKEILGDASDKGLGDDAIYKACGKRFADEKAAAKPPEKR